jgi:hypothetical protein
VAGSLTESFRATEASCNAWFRAQYPDRSHDVNKDFRVDLAPFVSIVLYLCSTAREIVGRGSDRKPSAQPRYKHTWLKQPQTGQPKIWEVAFRLGAILRATPPSVPGPDQGGTHATPRSHLRRAHWHAFWTGPKASPDRKLILKWLHPVLVNASDQNGIPTIHSVRGSE